MGGATFKTTFGRCNFRFQSTLPVGGATITILAKYGVVIISIHAPRGGSDPITRLHTVLAIISIHAPRGGSDYVGSPISPISKYFNPRSPWGERPIIWVYLLELSDFNPRSPWGERPSSLQLRSTQSGFQSTLPVGGATAMTEDADSNHQRISIHAPRGGSDITILYGSNINRHFNPRSPWGERQFYCSRQNFRLQFQSTLPVGGATCPWQRKPLPMGNFNPRSPWGERRRRYRTGGGTADFNPRSPWGERLEKKHHQKDLK